MQGGSKNKNFILLLYSPNGIGIIRNMATTLYSTNYLHSAFKKSWCSAWYNTATNGTSYSARCHWPSSYRWVHPGEWSATYDEKLMNYAWCYKLVQLKWSHLSNFVNYLYKSYPQVQLFLFEIGYVCIPFWVYCLVHPHLWKYEYINLYRQKSKRCACRYIIYVI